MRDEDREALAHALAGEGEALFDEPMARHTTLRIGGPVDAWDVPDLPLPQLCVVKGDGSCASIMAASILAKVYRDRLMIDYDRQYPGYGFAEHKGYATAAHRRALRKLGPSPIHRMSWAPIRAVLT